MWETDKWVLEWVIGHAIAHLHGLGIRAGVHRTQAHHLNPESLPGGCRTRETTTLSQPLDVL